MEIDAMKKCFLSQKGPKAIGPYSSAVIAGSCCYMSGMLGIDPETGFLASDSVEAQARQAMQNICTVLEEMGLAPSSILKTTVFMADLNDFAKVNAIYAEFFGPDYPARSCVQVARLPMDAKVEIEAIATME